MNRLTKKEMKKLLDASGIAIENSRKDASVMEKVSEFGYNEETLQAAEELHKAAEKLYLEKGPKTGQKISLSIQVREKIEKIHSLYMLYVKVLRREVRNNHALYREFNLEGRRDYSISGMVKESKGFYKNCLKNKKQASFVEKYGLTAEKLQSHLQDIAAVEQDSQYKALAVMESEKATEDRNHYFQKLSDWWYNYKAVLTYVFQDDPQQLEAFHIKAYSPGYKPNRKTAAEEDAPQPGIAAA